MVSKKIEKFLSNEANNNIYIFGNISEKMSFEVVTTLVELSSDIIQNGMIDPEITVFVNTEGGDLTEMYAIYDMMEFIKNKGIAISTIGIGKVMSAGLILLGAGTKGKRKISKNTRLMLHEIQTEYSGSISELKTEIQESDLVQNQYLDSLIKATNKNKTFFENIIKNKINYYFSPQVAVEWGLADEIFDNESISKFTNKKSK